MECLWRLFCYRQPAGYCHQQDQAILYVCVYPYYGFSHYHLHGTGLFQKCEEICDCGKKESLVLFIISCIITPACSKQKMPDNRHFSISIHCNQQLSFSAFTAFPGNICGSTLTGFAGLIFFVLIITAPFFPFSPYNTFAFSAPNTFTV